MTQSEFAARRSMLVDAVARRNELRASELAEQEALREVALEMYEAAEAVDGDAE
jgi:hypothetical protein